MFLTHFGIGQSRTSFIFSSSILILSNIIITLRNLTFLIFHLHFSSFTYKLIFANLLITFFTNSLCHSSISVLIITSLMKFATLPVLMRSCRISFIMVWNITSELVSPKNITVSLKNLFGIVNAAFYSSPFFICILLYPYHKSIFVNTFLVPISFTMSEMRGKG